MGRVRKKLAEKLSSFFGWTVNPYDLIPATGSWRTNISLDVYRWEGSITDENGIRRVIGSYDTMTDLVKCNSFEVNEIGEIFGSMESKKIMTLYTDYPIVELGDVAGEEAPIREVEPLSYDGDKYCMVRVDGVVSEIKAGYIYTAKGRCGEVECFNPNTFDYPQN